MGHFALVNVLVVESRVLPAAVGVVAELELPGVASVVFVVVVLTALVKVLVTESLVLPAVVVVVSALELPGAATVVLVLVVLTALLRVVASVTAETAKNITWI